MQLRYSMGPADYWPDDWSRVARDSHDPPCAHCHDPVMSRRRDGRGRPAHLVCRIRVRQRAEADT